MGSQASRGTNARRCPSVVHEFVDKVPEFQSVVIVMQLSFRHLRLNEVDEATKVFSVWAAVPDSLGNLVRLRNKENNKT